MYKCLVNSDFVAYFFFFNSFKVLSQGFTYHLPMSPHAFFSFCFSHPSFPQFLPRCGKPMPIIPVLVETEGSGVRGQFRLHETKNDLISQFGICCCVSPLPETPESHCSQEKQDLAYSLFCWFLCVCVYAGRVCMQVLVCVWFRGPLQLLFLRLGHSSSQTASYLPYQACQPVRIFFTSSHLVFTKPNQPTKRMSSTITFNFLRLQGKRFTD